MLLKDKYLVYDFLKICLLLFFSFNFWFHHSNTYILFQIPNTHLTCKFSLHVTIVLKLDSIIIDIINNPTPHFNNHRTYELSVQRKLRLKLAIRVGRVKLVVKAENKLSVLVV